MEDDTEKVVFTGDTLFIGGRGLKARIEVKVRLLSGIQVAEDFLRVHQQRCMWH